MRKEYICKECGGHATKEYYQENPDCKQCPEYEGCSGAINGHCIISSKDTCPSCQDGHIPLSEMIMMVNEALCDANRAFREGLRWEEGRSVTNIIEKLKPEKIDGYYKKWCIYRAEHYLALAVVRLREIAGIMGVILYKPEYPEGDLDLQMIADVQRFIGCIIHGFMEYFERSDIDSFSLPEIIECINILCNHHKIDLSAHIEALIAYEKESE